jgi:hypothetical protein
VGKDLALLDLLNFKLIRYLEEKRDKEAVVAYLISLTIILLTMQKTCQSDLRNARNS